MLATRIDGLESGDILSGVMAHTHGHGEVAVEAHRELEPRRLYRQSEYLESFLKPTLRQ
jgi:hypothetical protein